MTCITTKISSIGAAILICLNFVHSGTANADPIEGTWLGGGIMKPASGDREKVRCKMKFSKEADRIFSFYATCAATSGNISQSGEVLRTAKNRYSGNFFNSQSSVSGKIRVVVSGKSQSISVSSVKGTGRIRLRKQ